MAHEVEARGRLGRLSAREVEIVQCLLAGYSSQEVADILGISFHTVRTHIRNIYQKTGAASRVELYKWSLATDTATTSRS